MPVGASDLKRHGCATKATDFTTQDIGGGIGSELTGASVGETFFEMPSHEDGSGNGDRVQHGKEFIKNNHADHNYINAKIYLPNALDDFGSGQDTLTLQGDHADDDSSKFARIIGLDVNGDPVTLERALNGVTQVVTLDQMTWVSRVTTHLQENGSLTPLAGNLTIARGNGTVLGEIPAGYYSATSEVDIALSGSLDDTLTIADAADSEDDLSGFTFSRPRVVADAIDCANSGVIPGQSAQGYWLRLTVKEGIQPSVDVEYLPAITGQAQGA